MLQNNPKNEKCSKKTHKLKLENIVNSLLDLHLLNVHKKLKIDTKGRYLDYNVRLHLEIVNIDRDHIIIQFTLNN